MSVVVCFMVTHLAHFKISFFSHMYTHKSPNMAAPLDSMAKTTQDTMDNTPYTPLDHKLQPLQDTIIQLHTLKTPYSGHIIRYMNHTYPGHVIRYMDHPDSLSTLNIYFASSAALITLCYAHVMQCYAHLMQCYAHLMQAYAV